MSIVAKLCPVCSQAMKQVGDTHWRCGACETEFVPRRALRFGLGSIVRLYLTAVAVISVLWGAVIGGAALLMHNPSLTHDLLSQGLNSAIRLWPCNPLRSPIPILALPVLAALIVFLHASYLHIRPIKRVHRATNLTPLGWALGVLFLSYLPLGGLVLAMYVERCRFLAKYGASANAFKGVAGLPVPLELVKLPPASIEEARKLLRDGKVDDALVQLQRLVEGETANADAMSILGVAYAQKRNFGQAEEALRAAADMSPQSAAIHYNLSLVLHQRGKYMEASWEAQKCLDQGYAVPESFLDQLAEQVRIHQEQLVTM